MVSKFLIKCESGKLLKNLDGINLESPHFADLMQWCITVRGLYNHVYGPENDFTAEIDEIEADAAKFSGELPTPDEDDQRVYWKKKLFDRLQRTVVDFEQTIDDHGLPPGYKPPTHHTLISNTMVAVGALAIGAGIAWWLLKDDDKVCLPVKKDKLKFW
ncbi:hypothetical protein GF420_02785 [candidate division GN15 bacterium]|nr:hypothetical protein [candidate division GN15 bacterium]